MMRYNILSLGMVAVSAAVATAGPFGLIGRRGQNGGQPVQSTQQGPVRTVVAGTFSSAQGVANHMAHILRIGHFGGNSGFEGVDCGSTPQQAEMSCCYRNRWQPREVGLAQGRNGMWYACCRY